MSLDFLQVGVSQTSLRAPLASTANFSSSVALANGGLVVDDRGNMALRSTPADGVAATTATTGGTLTIAGGVHRLTTGGAVTGYILSAGVQTGQQVTLINTSGNSITFAAAGTSRVADGTSAVIAANTRMVLTWDATSARWYHGN